MLKNLRMKSFADSNLAEASSLAFDLAVARKLWEYSSDLVKF